MTLGDITAKIVANTKQFESQMESVKKSLAGIGDDTSKTGNKAGVALKAMGNVAVTAAATTVAALTAIVKTGIGVAGQLESARQGFVALLGSAEEADAVMTRIKHEAKVTPFELTGLTKGAQALTAITKDGQKSIDILMDVGKAVAISGKGNVELERVIINLQQIAATGKVTAMDIRQFQSAVPIFNDIIAAVGLTVPELQDAENAADLLFEAFHKAGEEGGIAAEGFSSQAGTWEQLVSNMKDSWAIFTADFVEKTGVFDVAKGAIETITNFMTDKMTPAITKGVEVMKLLLTGDYTSGTGEALGVDEDDPIIEKILNIRNKFIELGERIEEVWRKIKEKWEEYGQPIFDMIVELIENTIVPAWEYLKETIKRSMEESGLSMEQVKEILKVVALVVGGILVGAVVVLVGAIGGLIFILGVLVDWFTTVRHAAKEQFEKIKENIQWHIDKIKGIFEAGSFKEGLLNAMKYPFEAFWKWITDTFNKIKNTIQNALDLTKRSSPSVIDTLKAGINLAEKELGKLADVRIEPIAHLMGGENLGTGGGINLSIDMAGANISSPDIAQEYAEQIGDAIIGKLRTNRRSYG